MLLLLAKWTTRKSLLQKTDLYSNIYSHDIESGQQQHIARSSKLAGGSVTG